MDKWMNNNNFNKILALVFGIILFTMVHVDTAPSGQTTVDIKTKTIENVKIEVTGLDEDKYVLEPLAVDSVSLEVAGKNSDISFQFSDDYKVMLDLTKVEPGDTTLPLYYKLPKGVSLVRMNPKEVTVHVESRNTKSFPISLVTKGKPAEGYQIGTPVLQPTDTVEVTLADNELSKVAKIQGTIELNGENETFKEKKLKLHAYDKDGNEIKNAVIEPSTVSVELPITLPFKSLPLEIGFTGQLPDSLVLSKLTPEQEAVVVYGQAEALAALSAYEATVNLSAIDSAGTKQVRVDLKAPAGTEKVMPEAVNVSLTISEIAERTIEAVPIKLQGVGDELEGSIINPSSKEIALTLKGAPALLDQLDKKDIGVVADVSGLSAGTHEVSLRVSLPQFIALANSGVPLTVTVQLLSPAAPVPTPHPDTGGVTTTPEPSSEPVIGDEEPTEKPTHSGEAGATPTPVPTDTNPENNGTANTSTNSENPVGTGGT
ncbi:MULTISPECIES: CdaR family protein [Paenibacillus]|uniref:CdaR family protein n=1 Tax=Paenibacillus TaxID=44249 RepID=UPI0006899FF2|nr:CdaR family protein [Paenibacillus odorifer]MEC0134736.1 CdaR family protein [Paenibacillus odorifer]MEC0221907.1 CdaR family protein [Paenibacillus odorifer]